MKNLKLNKLAKEKLNNKQLTDTKGGLKAVVIVGPLCGCGCRYADNGGSSSNDNACANADGGLR
ncbi:rSAM-modified peptide [Ancylomarina salipaludis]|uniref:RSAM-modified peptide n=1 Tax=Ancylomarina salipaludis TaxID=2501299 RepID=A0A4Q1JKK3_9BACT|nr:TIGR04149 family rSAM-modified RiPP [Ancylomarina salipaludis]RXQ93053.1 rSAM-modified peptide [Ancylomarina salipaludis]